MVPLQEHHLNKADFPAAAVTFLAFFDAVPWPHVAAFLTCVYWVFRLIGMWKKWWRSK